MRAKFAPFAAKLRRSITTTVALLLQLPNTTTHHHCLPLLPAIAPQPNSIRLQKLSHEHIRDAHGLLYWFVQKYVDFYGYFWRLNGAGRTIFRRTERKSRVQGRRRKEEEREGSEPAAAALSTPFRPDCGRKERFGASNAERVGPVLLSRLRQADRHVSAPQGPTVR